MVHDPTLDAHEHAEHAEHAAHQGDPFISRVSITIAVLAVLAAVAGSLETVESGRAITNSSEAVLAQEKATDAWNEYQADSLKRHMYEIAADGSSANGDTYRHEAGDEVTAQGKARGIAQTNEHERDRFALDSALHEERHHWLTGAATLLEIGIALSTIAIVTRQRPFWMGAIGLGCLGVCLLTVAYGSF